VPADYLRNLDRNELSETLIQAGQGYQLGRPSRSCRRASSTTSPTRR